MLELNKHMITICISSICIRLIRIIITLYVRSFCHTSKSTSTFKLVNCKCCWKHSTTYLKHARKVFNLPNVNIISFDTCG